MTAEEWRSRVVLRETSRLMQAVPAHRPGEGRIGDCWRTGLACLLGAPTPTYVPHFVEDTIDHPDGHWEVLRVARLWLREMGLDVMPVKPEAAAEWDCPYLCTVQSKRGPWPHIVVAWGETIWHDPSGVDGGYSWGDRLEDASAEVLCEPYGPEPDEMVRRWAAEVGA